MEHKEALSSQHSAFSQNQQQQPFTAEDAKVAKERKGLSRAPGKPHGRPGQAGQAEQVDADERGLERDSEFVPMPGGYGYTRVRLQIEPERRPAEVAIVPGDRETRINLG